MSGSSSASRSGKKSGKHSAVQANLPPAEQPDDASGEKDGAKRRRVAPKRSKASTSSSTIKISPSGMEEETDAKEVEHSKQEDGQNYKMLVQSQEVLARRIKHLEEMLKKSESSQASSASARVDYNRGDHMDTSSPISASSLGPGPQSAASSISSGPISALAHPPSSETDADSKQIKTPGDLPKWYRKDNRMKAFDFIDVFEMCMISANIGKKHWPQQLLAAVQDVNHKRWVREKLVDPSVMDVYFTWETARITFIAG